MAFNQKLQKLVVDAGKHNAEVGQFMGSLKASLVPAEVKNMINAQAELTKRLAELLDEYVWQIGG